jgi:LPS sulfotransferase NodH
MRGPPLLVVVRQQGRASMAATGTDTIPLRRARRWQLDPARLWLRLQQQQQQIRLLLSWWLKSHTPYQAVFVLATHRSGSNLLVDYINRLPGVECRSEVLCPTLPIGPRKVRWRPEPALRHIRYSLHAPRSGVRGCKLMLDQLANCGLTLDALDAAFPSPKYIVLYRQSLAEQFLSREAAKATQQWVLLEGQERKQARVWINPAELRSYSDAVRRAYREVLAHSWLPQRAMLLSYEELVADPARCLRDRVCPLLGVPAVSPETCLRKQNTLPLAQRVANYHEVAALLASPLCRQQYVWPWQQLGARRAA